MIETYYVIWDDKLEMIMTWGKTRYHIKRANCQRKVDRINTWKSRREVGDTVSVKKVEVRVVTPE